MAKIMGRGDAWFTTGINDLHYISAQPNKFASECSSANLKNGNPSVRVRIFKFQR